MTGCLLNSDFEFLLNDNTENRTKKRPKTQILCCFIILKKCFVPQAIEEKPSFSSDCDVFKVN